MRLPPPITFISLLCAMLLACGDSADGPATASDTSETEASDDGTPASTEGDADAEAGPSDASLAETEEGDTAPPPSTTDIEPEPVEDIGAEEDADDDAASPPLLDAEAPDLCESLCVGVSAQAGCLFSSDAECEAWCQGARDGSCGSAYETHLTCMANAGVSCGSEGIEPSNPGSCAFTSGAIDNCELDLVCGAACLGLESAACARSPLPAEGCLSACGEDLTGPCGEELSALLGCNGDEGWSCDATGSALPDTAECLPQATAMTACLAQERCVQYCSGVSALPCAPWPDEASCVAECDLLTAPCGPEIEALTLCTGEAGYSCDADTQAIVSNNEACAEVIAALDACTLPVIGPTCPDYCSETEALLCRIKDGEVPEPDVPGCTDECLAWKRGACSEAFNDVLSCNGDEGFICLQDQPTPKKIAQCAALNGTLKACLVVDGCAPFCEGLSAAAAAQGCPGAVDALACKSECEVQSSGTEDCSESYADYRACAASAEGVTCSDDGASALSSGCEALWSTYATCAGLE